MALALSGTDADTELLRSAMASGSAPINERAARTVEWMDAYQGPKFKFELNSKSKIKINTGNRSKDATKHYY